MVFQFNHTTLDTVQYRMTQSGKQISVEPQVFDLLAYLLENRERVVSREELLANLWKGKIVTDAALGVCLKDARKTVGDNGRKQEVIKTIHGRGYQFIAEVAAGKSPETEADLASEKALPLPDKPSIAVLPFINVSGDPEQEYFVDGMTDEIITGLARVPGLFVIAYNSTMVYKGRAVDIKDVGREQGVRYVLEGGIRKSNNQIRVTAQLIDARSGLHLWAERYSGNLDDIFAVQDEITHKVVVELLVKLVTGERSRPWSTGTESVEAWELAIRGKSLIESHVRINAMIGRQLMSQALELDSHYSAAWTMLGWTYWEEAVFGWVSDAEKSMEIALDAAQKALAEDPPYPGAYGLLGHIYMVRDETEQAIAMSEKAIELAPSDSGGPALLGNVLIESGRYTEGIKSLQDAIRLSPFPPVWYLTQLAAGYHLNGDNENAISVLEQAAEREPDSALSRLWLASALVETKRVDEAKAISLEALGLDPTLLVGAWVSQFISDPLAQDRILKNLLAAGFPK